MSQATREVVAILDAGNLWLYSIFKLIKLSFILGAQYGKLIDRTIRELNIETELVDFKISGKEIQEKNYKAIVISGGPESVYSPTAPVYDPTLFSCGRPILGICYGMQVRSLFQAFFLKI